ncbi:MAG: hypothetical protein HZB39_00775 [Planctomycetes bacterium]|nr:hypothetical protein [Planctomycetota bacterium]
MRRKLALIVVGLCAGLVALELVLQVVAWVQWRRFQAAQSMPPGTVAGETVLCVGDSFTYGLGAADSANAYPAAAERELRVIDPATKLRFVNAGWAGSDSAAVLARLDAQLAVNRPRFVYVLVGYNDFWSERRVEGRDANAFPLELRTMRLASLIVAALRGGPDGADEPPATALLRSEAPFLGAWHHEGVWVDFKDDGRVVTSNGDLPSLWSHDGTQVFLDDRESRARTAIEWRIDGVALALSGGPFPGGIVLAKGMPERNALERGRAARQRGELDAAERELRAALDDLATSIDARLDLATLLADRGRGVEGAPLLEPVLGAFGQGADVALGRRLVDALLATGRAADATQVLERLLVELPIDDALVQLLARVGLHAGDPLVLDAAVERALARPEATKHQRLGLLGMRQVLRGDDPTVTLRCLVEAARIGGDESSFVRTVVWNRARFTREAFAAAVAAAGLAADERARVLAAFDAALARKDFTGEGLEQNLERIVAACRASGAEPVLLDYPLDRPSILAAVDRVAASHGVARLRLG